MSHLNHVHLLQDGQDQILTIPQEFALSSTEVSLRKEGNKLIVEPITSTSTSLLSLLVTLEEITEDFPNMDEGLLPLDDIIL